MNQDILESQIKGRPNRRVHAHPADHAGPNHRGDSPLAQALLQIGIAETIGEVFGDNRFPVLDCQARMQGRSRRTVLEKSGTRPEREMLDMENRQTPLPGPNQQLAIALEGVLGPPQRKPAAGKIVQLDIDGHHGGKLVHELYGCIFHRIPLGYQRG